MNQVLYFPPATFSPRFGKSFFTIAIETVDKMQLEDDSTCFCSQKEIVLYNITVKRGQQTWSVHKRFSEFDRLRQALSTYLPNEQLDRLPALPPKSIFSVASDCVWLDKRRTDLLNFMDKALLLLSEKRIIENSPVEDFLELPLH